MTHSINEIMLQRCVDGELTDHERSELLSQLDQQGSMENWKTLALSFVEHQVFANVFAEDAGSNELKSFQLARPASTDFSEPMVPAVKNSHWLHRPVRPWFSIAASLMVGMLVGVGGHFLMPTDSPTDERLVQLDDVPRTELPTFGNGLPEQMSRPQPHVPVMNVRLMEPGDRNVDSVAVPVYSPEQWQSLQQRGEQPLMSELPPELHQMLESQGMRVDHQHHWYRARLHDGREILVPTETMQVRHAIQ